MESRRKFQARQRGQKGRTGQQPRITLPGHADLVVGRNAARELLRFAPERIIRAYIAESRNPLGNPPGTPTGGPNQRDDLAAELAGAKIDVARVPLESLTQLAGNEAHQSIVLAIKPRVVRTLNECLPALAARESALVVLLDAIEDPQNFGAILRSAECFAADLVIWSRNRGVGITPAVTKASVGASELVELCAVANLADAAVKLRDEAGFWIVGADTAEGAVALPDFEFPRKTALVLGAEQSGMSRLMTERADFRVAIPLSGRINSLNVAQAAAIMLSSYRLRLKVS